MVISFLNPLKLQPKLPDGVHRELFAKEIAEVIPQNICFEKPTLAETIYGARNDHGKRVIVQRTELISLAMKPTAPGKCIFDLKYSRKQAQCVRDIGIQERLLEFLATNPDEPAWRTFCGGFHLKRKDGSRGPRVEFVTVNVGEPTEYKDLSKDGTGAFRKALKGHKGQLVYLDENKKPKVRAVYAYESTRAVHASLLEKNPAAVIKGFFQSGCLVEISNAVPHPKTPLTAGKYSLNTIRSDGFVVLTSSSGSVSQPIGLAKLLAGGFERID